MKITIVQGAFLPVPAIAGGAVEKLWFDLGCEFARRGLDVTHISRAWPTQPAHELRDGVQRLRVAGHDFPGSGLRSKLMDLAYSLRVLRCLWTQPAPDVVVTNTFFLPLLLSALPRRGRIYVSVHRYPQGQMPWYARVDRLQCVSTAIADAVREQAPSVAPLVKVVPNYVTTILSADEVRAGWDARRREVLYVGRINPEKGIELLLQAFADIEPAARAGWTLRVVGPHETAAGGGGADFLAMLKARAETLGIAVDWAGPIYDRAELNACYRRARLFVYPSTAARGEAFPLAPLEAMAQGCAAVTSDLRCFDDYIHDGVNARTFALGADPQHADASKRLRDVLQGLLNDATRLQLLAAGGLQTVQRFTLQRVADLFIDDFHALVPAAAVAAQPAKDAR